MKMDPNKDNVPEYDFSQGVRGKYVTRLGGTDPAWLKEMATRDAQRWVAEGLLRFQRIEASLVAYFALLHHRDVPEAGKAAWEVIENPRSTSYAILMTDLENYPETPPELKGYLTELLTERNWLVHRSFHSGQYSNDPAEFVDRLSSAASAAEDLDLPLYEFVLRRCVASGIPARQAEHKASEVIREWAAV